MDPMHLQGVMKGFPLSSSSSRQILQHLPDSATVSSPSRGPCRPVVFPAPPAPFSPKLIGSYMAIVCRLSDCSFDNPASLLSKVFVMLRPDALINYDRPVSARGISEEGAREASWRI